jgi:predicted phage gp36 major capsid-like protein
LRRTLARKEREWSALRGEYEQAIEEVEKEKEKDVENARRDATSHVSTELEELKQQVSTLDEENRRLRSERDAAVQKRVEDVGKCQHEWAQVYADLEKLYFKAKVLYPAASVPVHISDPIKLFREAVLGGLSGTVA